MIRPCQIIIIFRVGYQMLYIPRHCYLLFRGIPSTEISVNLYQILFFQRIFFNNMIFRTGWFKNALYKEDICNGKFEWPERIVFKEGK